MCRLLFGLIWAFLGLGSGTIFAADSACEIRLGTSFAAIVGRALEQGALTRDDVVALSRATRAFDPLANATRTSKNSAFAKFFALQTQMDVKMWAIERAKLVELLAKISVAAQASDLAKNQTRLLAAVPIHELNVKRYVSVEHHGRVFFATIGKNSVELHEIGRPDAIWSIQEDPRRAEIHFGKQDGRCFLVFYRLDQTSPANTTVHFNQFPFIGTFVDVESLEVTSEKKYSDTRTLQSSQWKYPSYLESKAEIQKIEPDCEASFYFGPYRSANGDLIYAAICSDNILKIYSDSAGPQPIFTYDLPAPVQTVAFNFEFFESKGVSYAALIYGEEPLKIFDIHRRETLAVFNFKGYGLKMRQIGDQVYWLVPSWSGRDQKLTVYTTFVNAP